jgi:hypothetical protein
MLECIWLTRLSLKIERGADFLHRQFFIVVKMMIKRSLRLSPLVTKRIKSPFWTRRVGSSPFFVFQDVDFANIFVAVGFVPFFVQADQVDCVGFLPAFCPLRRR